MAELPDQLLEKMKKKGIERFNERKKVEVYQASVAINVCGCVGVCVCVCVCACWWECANAWVCVSVRVQAGAASEMIKACV